ncbi:unnamed protein product [Orchesella dallaii]|uniref:BTB domain-containing protein n=1 Tax=Orchesella dallaii TaxID=48710 RepID=A0ABP1QFK1_9HEXA
MSKLYLVDCGKFQLHLSCLRRKNTSQEMLGKKKFKVFYNTKTSMLPSSHVNLYQATQDIIQESYQRSKDQMAAMFGQRVTVSFTISGSNPCKVKVEVEGRYLKKLLSHFGQPLKLNLSLTLGGWKKDNNGSVMKTPFIGNEYLNQRGGCIFKGETDVVFPRNFQHSLTVDGRMVIEIIPGDNVVFGPSPDHLTVMKGVYEAKALCDFNIIADTGKYIPCHKVFLSANSPAFARILLTECKETTENTYKLDLSERGADALLKYIYYRNLDDPLESCNIAFELMDIAHQYEIVGLENTIKDIFMGKSYLWYTIDVAVDLYLYTLKMQGYDQLKDELLKVIKMKFKQLEGSKVFQILEKEDKNTAANLLELCYFSN